MKRFIAGLVIIGILLCFLPGFAKEFDPIQYIKDQIEEPRPEYEEAVEQAKKWGNKAKELRVQIMTLQNLLKGFEENESEKEKEKKVKVEGKKG